MFLYDLKNKCSKSKLIFLRWGGGGVEYYTYNIIGYKNMWWYPNIFLPSLIHFQVG